MIVHVPDESAYTHLLRDAAQCARDDRLRMVFTGAKAAETLTGLVTNDILALRPGHGAYAAALTAKGKVIADLRIFCRGDGDFLVDTPAAAAAGFAAMIRKYVNPRLATYTDASTAMSCVGVVGPHARQVVAHALGVSPSEFDLLPPCAHVTLPMGDAPVMVARVPDYGVDGFDCFVAAEIAPALRDALRQAGAGDADPAALETLRIEAGRPAYGVDMSDDTLTQEANLDTLHAVSYTKGCYTGQETVARLHFRGHVNKHLRGVRAASLPDGAVEVMVGDKVVGDLRSRAVSPRLGAIGLAMVRREVEDGAEVTLRGATGDVLATVVPLPFTV